MGSTYAKFCEEIREINEFTASKEFFKYAGTRLEFEIIKCPGSRLK